MKSLGRMHAYEQQGHGRKGGPHTRWYGTPEEVLYDPRSFFSFA
jgi:hypothetical protein